MSSPTHFRRTHLIDLHVFLSILSYGLQFWFHVSGRYDNLFTASPRQEQEISTAGAPFSPGHSPSVESSSSTYELSLSSPDVAPPQMSLSCVDEEQHYVVHYRPITVFSNLPLSEMPRHEYLSLFLGMIYQLLFWYHS